MGSGWTAVVVISVVGCWMKSAALTHWRDRSEYPKSYDDFELYVTDPATPITGERALSAGCDADSKPYKYRGKNHITELRRVVHGQGRERVWVGAVDTTTPWVWTNGRYLYQLMGLTSPHLVSDTAIRLPGNNAFLCSLHCRQVSFVLLQGNKCACLKSKPKLLPVSGKLFRCPGTYEEFCGTTTAYTVYKNMLAKTVKWARLVDKARYHGNRAYLYRSPLSDHPLVSLKAEVDPTEKKGYICNDTVFTIGPSHIHHLWARHALTGAAVTWRGALEACMNEGKQLMMLSRDAKKCVQEVEGELEKAQSYWVGLSRQNVALWIDGTAVKTTVNNRHKGQAACLTMTLTTKTPTFTFESCSDLSLPVLCERSTNSRLQTFTHDAQGNHITIRAPSDDLSDWTVSILVAVLVVLSLLSIVLLLLLYHRDKWIPRKSQSASKETKPSEGKICIVSPSNDSHVKIIRKAGVSVPRTPDKEHVHVIKVPMMPGELHTDPDARLSYGGSSLNKGKPPCSQPPWLTGNGNSRPISAASMDYTEVHLPGECDGGCSQGEVCGDSGVVVSPTYKSQTLPPALNEVERRPSSLRMLEYQTHSSHSSATGSDEAYSVLGYRRSILNAWSDVKRTAYAHVMLNQPMRGEDDQSALYDVAPHSKPPRTRCIDNDYDHTEPEPSRTRCIDNDYDHTEPEPRVTRAQSLSCPHEARLTLEVSARCNDSDV